MTYIFCLKCDTGCIMGCMRYRTVSGFSQEFAHHLRDILRESPKSVTQSEIADALPNSRTQGYVSERLNGKRPIDTDMIAVIAELIGRPPAMLIGEVLGRMGRGGLLDPREGMDV